MKLNKALETPALAWIFKIMAYICDADPSRGFELISLPFVHFISDCVETGSLELLPNIAMFLLSNTAGIRTEPSFVDASDLVAEDPSYQLVELALRLMKRVDSADALLDFTEILFALIVQFQSLILDSLEPALFDQILDLFTIVILDNVGDSSPRRIEEGLKMFHFLVRNHQCPIMLNNGTVIRRICDNATAAEFQVQELARGILFEMIPSHLDEIEKISTLQEIVIIACKALDEKVSDPGNHGDYLIPLEVLLQLIRIDECKETHQRLVIGIINEELALFFGQWSEADTLHITPLFTKLEEFEANIRLVRQAIMQMNGMTEEGIDFNL
jgi:hypothetical protein